VIVSLPARPNRILTRELLYTAVTRAIESVVIIGSNDVFAQALAKKVNRVSSLTARIVARSLALGYRLISVTGDASTFGAAQ
jgi:exodeoxyribonuclease V alpha subunit